MKTFYCDICTAPMVMTKQFSNHITNRSNCRRRRFKCSICDFEKTIYADGKMDEEVIPNNSIEKSNRDYKQEENNRL